LAFSLQHIVANTVSKNVSKGVVKVLIQGSVGVVLDYPEKHGPFWSETTLKATDSDLHLQMFRAKKKLPLRSFSEGGQ